MSCAWIPTPSTRCASSACVTSGENGSHVREALALWRGPPLDDLADEPFAAPEIRRLEDLWLRAREAAIDAELADGRHAAVLGELDELVRAHPLRERLHGQRMLALYRCGRQAEALEAFRERAAGPARRGRARAGPRAAWPQRRDPAPGPGSRRSAPAARCRAVRGGASRWLLVAAGVAIAVAVALAVLQLAGSGGLDEVSEDATGVIDRGERAHRRPVHGRACAATRSRRAVARCGSPTAATGRSRASIAAMVR